MIASAALRSSNANKRALSLVTNPKWSTNLRARALWFAAGLVCQKAAAWVYPGVRAVLSMLPSDLTSA
jgi:hypothetical protein